MKHNLTLTALLVASALFHAPAFAQADYPNKQVTLVTAFAPGSGPDATLRLVAEKTRQALESACAGRKQTRRRRPDRDGRR